MGEALSRSYSSESESRDGKAQLVKKKRITTSYQQDGVDSRGEFFPRHVGPASDVVTEEMLAVLGYTSLDELTDRALPPSIQLKGEFESDVFPEALSETDALARIEGLATQNRVRRSYIGMGYYGTIVPGVIQRNILENPGWYTQYTPYQPEISQGRLEALLNYQTMVADLTGLPIVNASLLDEGTAAAEAMTVAYAVRNKRGKEEVKKFFVAEDLHPQTIAVIQTRAEAVGVELDIGSLESFTPSEEYFAALLQYPNTEGFVGSPQSLIKDCQSKSVVTIVASDLLALTLLRSPGSMGADICIGSAQRFGVPLGFGGPHAAFFATKEEHKRIIPGRLVGVSIDRAGKPALRLALQTREQHIRREKATSNICTAQVLLSIMAGMYGVFHGPDGLKNIARRVHGLTSRLGKMLKDSKLKLQHESFFDTITVLTSLEQQSAIEGRADEANISVRSFADGRLSVSLDESTKEEDLVVLYSVLTGEKAPKASVVSKDAIDAKLLRDDEILTAKVFHAYRSETEFLRYVKRLESRDLSLAFSMIPLGSCTMKLNATSEMLPVTMPGFSSIHPFAASEDTNGYKQLFAELEQALQEVTGFDAVSLQPNAGSQGEYAGLIAIRRFHLNNNDSHRDICLIPTSAHGTNPASAVMAGMKVVVVQCDDEGNIDIADLKRLATEHKENLSCLMVTYPSTHGVFETEIKEICEVIHSNGGQVYMDGANLNALVGLSRPADFGADVCHINLHKTFCIPHGGGGPGMGPIGVSKHLAPFLPGHVSGALGEDKTEGAVSAAPWGSASILPISWMYMAMMGAEGMKQASQYAILSANYIAKKLEKHYPVLYRGNDGLVAHECILDVRSFKELAGIEAADIAKRLMDYGFHAPTMSWPVAGTLMVEPTESESKEELDRFCDAMIAIREEVSKIENGTWSREDNPLKNAPHTAEHVIASEWTHPYTREEAAYPAPWNKEAKFWPFVGRIEESYGDRNLVCTCPSIDEYE